MTQELLPLIGLGLLGLFIACLAAAIVADWDAD